MGSSPKPPKPTAEERAAQAANAALLNTQNRLLSEQNDQNQALLPALLKLNNITQTGTDANGKPIYDIGPPTPEQIAYNESIQAQLKNLKFSEALAPLTLKQQGYDVQLDANGLPTGVTLTPGGAADLAGQLQKQQLQTGSQQYEVNQLLLDRTKKALAGELPLPANIERQFTEGEQQVRENLRRNLGSNYETSTPGIQALDNFRAKKAEVTDAIRHGEISTADALAIQGQGVRPATPNPYAAASGIDASVQGLNPFASQGTPAGRSSQLLSAINSPYASTQGAFGQLAGQYGQFAAQLANKRNGTYQQALQSYGQQAQQNGTIGATAGAVIGGVVGGIAGWGNPVAIGAGATLGGAAGGAIGRYSAS